MAVGDGGRVGRGGGGVEGKRGGWLLVPAAGEEQFMWR